MSEDVQKWEEKLKETMQLSSDTFGGNIFGLAVVIFEDGEYDGKYVERVSIFEELMIRRHELEKKNLMLERIGKRFVTNATT